MHSCTRTHVTKDLQKYDIASNQSFRQALSKNNFDKYAPTDEGIYIDETNSIGDNNTTAVQQQHDYILAMSQNQFDNSNNLSPDPILLIRNQPLPLLNTSSHEMIRNVENRAGKRV